MNRTSTTPPSVVDVPSKTPADAPVMTQSNHALSLSSNMPQGRVHSNTEQPSTITTGTIDVGDSEKIMAMEHANHDSPLPAIRETSLSDRLLQLNEMSLEEQDQAEQKMLAESLAAPQENLTTIEEEALLLEQPNDTAVLTDYELEQRALEMPIEEQELLEQQLIKNSLSTLDQQPEQR